jgi:hypothetical protein
MSAALLGTLHRFILVPVSPALLPVLLPTPLLVLPPVLLLPLPSVLLPLLQPLGRSPALLLPLPPALVPALPATLLLASTLVLLPHAPAVRLLLLLLLLPLPLVPALLLAVALGLALDLSAVLLLLLLLLLLVLLLPPALGSLATLLLLSLSALVCSNSPCDAYPQMVETTPMVAASFWEVAARASVARPARPAATSWAARRSRSVATLDQTQITEA